MKCYICKKQIDSATRKFMPARNRREKNAFRDLCGVCYVKTMEAEGYVFQAGIWRKS